MADGFIVIHRKMLDWEWYTEPNVFRMFSHLILKANYDRKKWRGISINRGEFVTSLQALSDETGLSVSKVRTALKKLEMTNVITNTSSNKYRLISIINYNKYQCCNKLNNKQTTSNSHAESQSNNNQIATTNNKNNSKKDISKDISKKERKVGSRLPDDWELPKEWGDWAFDKMGMNEEEINSQEDTFKDHWIAKAGKDATKKDWYATWRNWCRNYKKRKEQRYGL